MIELPKHKKNKVFDHINVTPFVDVMLVLLVIFMITAPMLDNGFKINLPKAKADQLENKSEPVIVYLKQDKVINIDGFDANINSLSTRIKILKDNKGVKELFIKADKDLSYGFVAEVMSKIKEAGITQIGLVTSQDQDKTGDSEKNVNK